MTDTHLLKELSRYNLGTFADYIYRNALLHPENEAFVYADQRMTFGRYNRRVNRLIHALESEGVRKGDVIGVLSWNCMEYMDVQGAAMKGGYIAALYNPRLHPEELEQIINYSGANTLFVGPGLVETVTVLRSHLSGVKRTISFGQAFPDMPSHNEWIGARSPDEPDVNIQKDDPFLILFTSGTTGAPRGALYTHYRKLQNVQIKVMEMGTKPEDRHILAMPLFHIGGDSHVWPFFIVAACTIMMPQRSFDPEAVLQTIQEEKATDLQIVPTQLNAMLSCRNFEAYDLSTLKRIYYASSPMPVELLRKGLEKFGHIFSQGYGQTESGPQITTLPRKAHQVLDKAQEDQEVLNSCGQPSYNVHVRIVDEEERDVGPGVVGEIIVQSESIMVEYWQKPEETRETIRGGWLHTGDLGYYDEKGFIYIVDRKKDMIVTGGENVYSRQVEEVLYQHPDVAEVAVIGVPDPVWVERVHAVVALRRPGAVSEEELIAFCKGHMASYKAPKTIEFIESLPKNPQGKILKKELRRERRT